MLKSPEATPETVVAPQAIVPVKVVTAPSENNGIPTAACAVPFASVQDKEGETPFVVFALHAVPD
jgi:hypothetical protein